MTIRVRIEHLDAQSSHAIAVDLHHVDRHSGERTVMPTQTVRVEPGTSKELFVWRGQELVVREAP